MINPQICPYSGDCDLRTGKVCRGLSDTYFPDHVCRFRKIGGEDYLRHARRMISDEFEPESISIVTGLSIDFISGMMEGAGF